MYVDTDLDGFVLFVMDGAGDTVLANTAGGSFASDALALLDVQDEMRVFFEVLKHP